MKHKQRGVAYRCPACSESIDCHHHVNGEMIQPSVEDVLVCAHCKAIMEVIDDRQGIARILSTEEFDALPSYIKRSIQMVMEDWESRRRKVLED
jgi:uncharacterized protein YbaR (Trm112 family)